MHIMLESFVSPCCSCMVAAEETSESRAPSPLDGQTCEGCHLSATHRYTISVKNKKRRTGGSNSNVPWDQNVKLGQTWASIDVYSKKYIYI